MSVPRLEIETGRIERNARHLVAVLGKRGISVTGVTKAGLGSAEVAGAMLRGGVTGLGDSRIENIEALQRSGVTASITLVRSPMLSQVDRVVRHAGASLNTEMDVIEALSVAARSAGSMHGIVLMVELGDLREGILPADVAGIAHRLRALPNIEFVGIGTNLACRSGIAPDSKNMAALSALANALEAAFACTLAIVSGGNSANLLWALGESTPERINDLRLGESILLGREPLHRTVVPGLRTDAFRLVGEVIESKIKGSVPVGTIAQTAFGEPCKASDQGEVAQSLLALGRQDIDHQGLIAPPGIRVIDATSDHLIVTSARCLRIGSEITFELEYGALLRAMTSPFVDKVFIGDRGVNS